MPSSRRESSFSYKHTPTSLSETKKLLPGVLQRTIIKGENECSEMNSPTNIDSNGKKNRRGLHEMTKDLLRVYDWMPSIQWRNCGNKASSINLLWIFKCALFLKAIDHWTNKQHNHINYVDTVGYNDNHVLE